MRGAKASAAAVAGVLLLAPVAGCGGSSDNHASAPRTSASPLAAGEVAPEAFVARLLAAMKTKDSARVTLSLGGRVIGTGDVSYGATTDARVTAHYGGQQLQIITAGGSSYFQQAAGAKFVRVSADDPAMGGFVKALAYIGPREALQAIAPGITKVRATGSAAADGARSWIVTVKGDVVGKALAFGAADLPKSIDLTFTVAGDGLLSLVAGDLGDQPLRLAVGRWGVPVHIAAPAAGQLLNQ